MRELKKIIFGILIVSGLLLAGAEAPTIEVQLIGSTLGLILFVVGGYGFVGVCKKLIKGE